VTALLDPESIWPLDQQWPADVVWPLVTVYTISGCHACEELRRFLDRRCVPVVVKDVSVDRRAARELVFLRRGVPNGIGQFPLVVIGGTVVVGFDAPRIRDLLLAAAGRRSVLERSLSPSTRGPEGKREGAPEPCPDSGVAQGSDDDRPLPFVLRVGNRWADIRDAPSPGEAIPLMFRRRASLTGDLALTQGGQDVQFSDIGVEMEDR